jgi:membrane-anchored glycerophosphoryl diester phosphodiesterase (GDPDase)
MSLDVPAAIEDGLRRVPTRIALLLVVAYLAVGVVAIRTFVADARRSLPAGVTHRFAWVVANALVAGFVVNLLSLLGLALLIVPGIYVSVALYFVQFEVVVEGKNAFEAIRDGWALTAGDRLQVFLLLVALVAVGVASAVPAFVLDLAGVPSLASTAVTVVLGAVVSVFSVAVGARAYVQLKPGGPSPGAAPLAD